MKICTQDPLCKDCLRAGGSVLEGASRCGGRGGGSRRWGGSSSWNAGLFQWSPESRGKGGERYILQRGRMLCCPRKAGEAPRADGSSDDHHRGFLVSWQWAQLSIPAGSATGWETWWQIRVQWLVLQSIMSPLAGNLQATFSWPHKRKDEMDQNKTETRINMW